MAEIGLTAHIGPSFLLQMRAGMFIDYYNSLVKASKAHAAAAERAAKTARAKRKK